MPKVHLAPNLRAAYPAIRQLGELRVPGATTAEALERLDRHFPGLVHYLVDEEGQLRPHVRLFIDGELVEDQARLVEPVGPDTEVHIIQAIAGR